MALRFDDAPTCKRVVDRCIEGGVLTDWFLFAPECLRLAPPLVITEDEIGRACETILRACGD
jgi:acetylornithine/succinyldiaminopimelate/putrescine aminotransferase